MLCLRLFSSKKIYRKKKYPILYYCIAAADLYSRFNRQYAAEILDFMYDPGSRMYVCIYLYVLRTYYRTGFVLLRNCIYTCRIYRFTGMAALYLSSKMEPAVSGRKPYPACDYLYWNVLGCFLSGSCTFDKRIFTGTLCMGTYLNRCAGNYDIRFQQHQFSGCRPAF